MKIVLKHYSKLRGLLTNLFCRLAKIGSLAGPGWPSQACLLSRIRFSWCPVRFQTQFSTSISLSLLTRIMNSSRVSHPSESGSRLRSEYICRTSLGLKKVFSVLRTARTSSASRTFVNDKEEKPYKASLFQNFLYCITLNFPVIITDPDQGALTHLRAGQADWKSGSKIVFFTRILKPFRVIGDT